MIRSLMHSLSSCLLACFSIAGALIAIGPAYGGSITMNLTEEFSGGTAPSGSPPWIQATFEDVGVDTVKLTMSDLTLAGNPNAEFVIDWLFNLDPTLNPTDLVFSALSVDAGSANTLALSDFTTGVDLFQANGDGLFDIMVAFDVSNPENQNKRFTAGDVVSVEITLAGLTADSFNFLSAMDGSPGTFFSAAQVGGIGPNDESGWIGEPIPEPTSGMLLLVGCFAGGLFAGRRKRR